MYIHAHIHTQMHLNTHVSTIAGLAPVLVSYLPACVLDRIGLSGGRFLHMLENLGQEFHPEMEGEEIINKIINTFKKMHKMYSTVASSNSSYAIIVCMPDSLLHLHLGHLADAFIQSDLS